MHLISTSDHRFYRRPDGLVVCKDQTHAEGFWHRYLNVFETVTIVARASDDFDGAGNPVCSDRVRFVSLPDYRGLKELLARRSAIRAILREQAQCSGAFLVRVPGQIGTWMADELAGSGTPYMAEVVGNPNEAFAKGSISHPLRPLIRWQGTRDLRRICRRASGVAYVTKSVLQGIYPPDPEAVSTHYSSIHLPATSFAERPRKPDEFSEPPTVACVAKMDATYKGHRLLLEATRALIDSGRDLRLKLIGGGQLKPQFEALAAELGLTQHVEFLGWLPSSDAVREEVQHCDLFVLPSLTEGLPRALIEALAAGLPAIGSDAGGIPELLPPDLTFPAGDAGSLAELLAGVLSDPSRLANMSAAGMRTAAEYRSDVLQARRDDFYRAVAERSGLADDSASLLRTFAKAG